jgi:phosphorylcholine metabolism protein LicD
MDGKRYTALAHHISNSHTRQSSHSIENVVVYGERKEGQCVWNTFIIVTDWENEISISRLRTRKISEISYSIFGLDYFDEDEKSNPNSVDFCIECPVDCDDFSAFCVYNPSNQLKEFLWPIYQAEADYRWSKAPRYCDESMDQTSKRKNYMKWDQNEQDHSMFLLFVLIAILTSELIIDCNSASASSN